MVIKIQNTYPHMKNTLDYNEQKVSANVAERIHTNAMSGNKKEIYDTFRKYERLNIRSDKVSFQMTINPNRDAGENLSDDRIIELTRRIMNHLGYENQPYVIYKHNDIDREHFHIVSIRTNEKGKKIRDYKEAFALQRLMKNLEKEFGFKVGEHNEKVKKPELADNRFSAQKGNVCNQYLAAFEKAMEYRFTTLTQFKAIMQWYGVDIDKRQEGSNEIVSLQGLDERGIPNSPFINQKELGRPNMLSEIMAQAEEHKKSKLRYMRERHKLEDEIRKCLNASKSEEHFLSLLKEKNVGCLISRRHDGSIFGITFVDHQSQMAFKSAELGKCINASILQELEKNGWDVKSVIKVEVNTEKLEQQPEYIQSLYDDESMETEDIQRNEGLELFSETMDALATAFSAQRNNKQPKKKRRRKK